MKRLFFLLALTATYALAQSFEYDAWEPREGNTNPLSKDENNIISSSPIDYLVIYLIRNYRNTISVKSISRCPFEISCSRFLEIAIKKYGLLGYAIFVDRYFYRENVSAYNLYAKKETLEGIIKLDDKIYLTPFKYNQNSIFYCRNLKCTN